MRLIDADKLLEKVYTIENGGIYGDCEVVDRHDIDNAPTVIPEDFMNPYQEGYERARKDFERPQNKWGKWIISEIRCPECLGYFQTDCYSAEELKKCPICGAYMKGAEE